MSTEELLDWGPNSDQFYRNAIIGLIGNDDLSRAFGALFADEVLATAWFNQLLAGFEEFSCKAEMKLDLSFFISHADEVEPAHAIHSCRLLKFCDEMNLQRETFADGYISLRDHLYEQFDGLHKEMR